MDHHALLRPPMTSPRRRSRRGLNTQKDKARAGRRVGRSADKPKTYSTFLDWRNHLSKTHPTCIRDGDPLLCAKYAAGFKLEDWGRFHNLDGNDTDSYQHVVGIRGRYGRYGRYQGQVEGQPPGPPSTFRLHHIKGSTPDKDTTLTESERAGSECGGSDLEESREALEEGEVQEDYTSIRSRETDTESDDATLGRESRKTACLREVAVPSTPRRPTQDTPTSAPTTGCQPP